MARGLSKSLRRRLFFLRLGFLLLAGVAFARLYQLQIVEHKSLAARAASQRQTSLKTSLRGGIYDRNGRELAVSLPVASAYLVPPRFKDYERLGLIAGALDMEPSQLERLVAGSQSFVWLKRKLTPRQRKSLQELKINGLGFVPEKKRFYPKKMLASHVLGIVGMDGTGLEGLEYRFEETLWGGKGKGNRYDLVLTIDETIQYIAQQELSAACQGLGAKAGSVIVMEPHSGEILAMANYPGFNPNSFSRYPIDVRRNRAITDAYEPGSTIKVFTAAAALEEGIFNPASQVWCEEGEISIGDLTIKDSGKHGMLSFTQVIERSSNVGAIKIGLALGKKRLYRYLRDFGFGAPTGVDFPGESAGILRPPQQWSKVSPGALSIGQEIAVTPLQVVTAMAAVANGGRLVKPRLVRAVQETESKRIVKSFLRGQSLQVKPLTPQEGQRVISAATARRLSKILSGVVERGTGREAALPNIKVAGKTGTAQKIDPLTGSYAENKVVASFIGYFPAGNPQLVILTMLDEPQRLAWGGKAAAPLFRRIASQVAPYLGIVPGDETFRVAVQ